MQFSDPRISIQQAMRQAFPEYEARVTQFYQMQEYHLGWRDETLAPAEYDPGKLLRPQLALLACSAVGGDPAQAMPLAAGIQLVHDFSLIHDDIEDNSDTRRGRTTVWKQWGLAQGVNTGDGMFVVAHLALHGLAKAGVPAEVALEVLRRFDETILTICEGQFLDISFEGKQEITEADYLAMIGRKTAALVAASTGLGAILGGASAAQARALFDFGQHLGLAFQIQDDVLGIWGDPELTGKPFAADLYRRKLSLPVIHGLATADQRAELAVVYAKPELGDADVAQALKVLDAAGSRAYTEGVGAYHHQQALAALGTLPAGPATTHLHGIAQSLVQRSR